MFWIAIRICNAEAYKLKGITRSTVLKWTTLLEQGKKLPFSCQVFCNQFTQLLRTFQYVLWQDSLVACELSRGPWFQLVKDKDPNWNFMQMVLDTEFKTFDGEGLLICDFCGADVWNRFVQCSMSHGNEPYVVCLGCYAEGRGCGHRGISTMSFYQMFNLETAEEDYVRAVTALNTFARSQSLLGFVDICENWKVG